MEKAPQTITAHHYWGPPVDSLSDRAQKLVRGALVAAMPSRNKHALISVDMLDKEIYTNGGYERTFTIDQGRFKMASFDDGDRFVRITASGLEDSVLERAAIVLGFDPKNSEAVDIDRKFAGRDIKQEVWVPKPPEEAATEKQARKTKIKPSEESRRLFGSPFDGEYKPRNSEVDKSEDGARFHGLELPARQEKLAQRQADIEAIEERVKAWSKEYQRRQSEAAEEEAKRKKAEPERIETPDALKREAVLAGV